MEGSENGREYELILIHRPHHIKVYVSNALEHLHKERKVKKIAIMVPSFNRDMANEGRVEERERGIGKGGSFITATTFSNIMISADGSENEQLAQHVEGLPLSSLLLFFV